MHRFFKDRRGSTALMFALGAVPLIGLAGLGTEAGMWYVTQRQAQNAADSTALAGAMTLGSLPSGVNWSDAHAKAIAKANGFDPASPPFAGTTQTVTITPPTVDNLVTATITQTQPTMLASVMGLKTVAITAVATAGVNKTQSDVCFLALGTSATALTITGNSTFTGDGCSMMSNGGIKLGSPPSLATGSSLLANQGCTSASACTSVTSSNYHVPEAYNPLAKLDAVNSGIPATNGGGKTPNFSPLTPGSYSTLSIKNGDNYVLNAGTYYFDSINISNGGSLSGTGVNIVVFGNITATGGTINLTAGSGNTVSPAVLDGVVLYDKGPPGTSIKLPGGPNMSFTGAIYAPNADVTWAGNASTGLNCAEVIALTLTINGTQTTNVNTQGCPLLGAPVPKEQLVWLVK